MAVTQTPLGSLNRLVASAIFVDNPQLNLTPPFLGRRAISISPDTDATTFINMLTGMVTSPEPYIGVTVTLNINKALPIAAVWQAQWLLTTTIGICTIRPDVAASQGGIQPFPLANVGIMRIGNLPFDGTDATLVVTLRGTYYINNLQWSGAI